MTRALVHGAGRMARRVVALLRDYECFELVGLVSRTRTDEISDVVCFISLDEVNCPVDLLIDFTLPGGAGLAAQWCEANNVA